MSGYTPVFSSVFTGTLCGRYPDTAAWLFLLALADKSGVVDMTAQYISSVTGMPVADLMACINRFMQPDPHSRSTAEEGRRLVPIAEDRGWGWRIVNHALYRERARLAAKNEREVASGANAERMDRRRPPLTAADPLSDSDSPPPPREKTPSSGVSPRRPSKFVPDEFVLTVELRNFSLAELPDLDVDAEFSKFRDHEFLAPKVDWPRAWRRWVREGKLRGKYAKQAQVGQMTFHGEPVEWQ